MVFKPKYFHDMRKCQVGKSIHFWNPLFKSINFLKIGFIILGAGIKKCSAPYICFLLHTYKSFKNNVTLHYLKPQVTQILSMGFSDLYSLKQQTKFSYLFLFKSLITVLTTKLMWQFGLTIIFQPSHL